PGTFLLGDLRRGRAARHARRAHERRRGWSRARARAARDRGLRPLAEGQLSAGFHDTGAKRCAGAAAVRRTRSGDAAGVRRRSREGTSEQPACHCQRLRAYRVAARVRTAAHRGVRRHRGIRDAAAILHRLFRALEASAVLARSPGAAGMIALERLAKAFGKRRDVHAVRDVTFDVPNGAITGLLGPNGAGKTTLLRMIATLVVPDAGQARVDGLDAVADRYAVRARIGVLSDARGLYARLTARENVRYYGALHGLSGAPLE